MTELHWGLGVEHEFLVTTADSRSVVKAAKETPENPKHRDALRTIAGALRAAGFNVVDRTSASVLVHAQGIVPPGTDAVDVVFPSRDTSDASLRTNVKSLGDGFLKPLLQFRYPMLFLPAGSWGILLPDALLPSDEEAEQRIAELQEACLRDIAPESKSHRWVTAFDAVLGGAHRDRLAAFVREVEDVMRPVMSTVATELTMHVETWAWHGQQHCHVSLIDGDGTQSLGASFAAIVGAISAAMPIALTSAGKADWISVDGAFVEVRTLRYRDATIRSVMAELRKHERAALAAASGSKPKIVGTSGRVNAKGMPEYCGSFHVWFTMPHAEPVTQSESADFVAAHRRFAHALQWIEPMILAVCLGGDPRAIGNGANFPRASMRSVLNNVGGYGTADVCGRMAVTPLRHRALRVHKDLESLASGAPGDVMKRDVVVKVTYDGRRYTPIRQCQTNDRVPDHHWDRSYTRETELRVQKDAVGAPTDRPVTSSLNWLLAERGARYALKTGSDIRWPYICNPLTLARRSTWTPHVVMDPRHGAVAVFRKSDGTISKRVPPEFVEERPKKVAGFELRVLDNMPTACLGPLLHLFVLVMASSRARLAGRTCPGRVEDDRDWKLALVRASMGGSFARPPVAYVRKVERVLGVKLGGRKTFDALMASVADALHAAYGAADDVARLCAGTTGRPAIRNTNFAEWRAALESRLASDAVLAKKIDALSASATGSDEREWKRRARRALGRPWALDLPAMWARALEQRSP